MPALELDPISHLPCLHYPNFLTTLDRLIRKLSNESSAIFLGQRTGDSPLEAERKALKATQMPMVPHRSTGMPSLVMHSLLMVVLFHGALTNKSSLPCPPLKLNMSH